MYLSILKNDLKEVFLKLAYNLAYSDGNFSSDEAMMITQYCSEMKIPVAPYEKDHDINKDIEYASVNSTEKDRKIIVFECVGLAMSDGDYDNSERDFIERLSNSFNLPTSLMNECEKIISEYLQFQNRINDLIIN